MHGIIHLNGTNVVQRSEWIEDVSNLHFPPFPNESRSRSHRYHFGSRFANRSPLSVVSYLYSRPPRSAAADVPLSSQAILRRYRVR